MLLIALTSAGIVLIVVVLLLPDWLVLRKLARLVREVSVFGSSIDLVARVDQSGKNEISQLGKAVNWMLEQWEISGRKLANEHQCAEEFDMEKIKTIDDA